MKLIVLMLLVTACASDDSAASDHPTTSSTSPSEITSSHPSTSPAEEFAIRSDVVFVATEIAGDVHRGAEIRMVVRANDITIWTACETVRAGFRYERASLVFEDLEETRAGCDRPADWLVDFMASGPSGSVEVDEAWLSNAETSLYFVSVSERRAERPGTRVDSGSGVCGPSRCD